MLIGGWGARAGELLDREAKRLRTPLHQAGELALGEQPHAIAGHWSCWLFGEPEDRGALMARFGLRTDGELPAAFARALAELGDAACELLCGRFVAVTLDREQWRCTVTRDQLGAHPLVYTQFGGATLFAAHERDLLTVLPRAPSLDRLALLRWIEDGLTPPRRTLFEGVQRLPAGHRLILGEAHERVQRWWSPRYEGTDDAEPAELGERLREAAFAAVARAA